MSTLKAVPAAPWRLSEVLWRRIKVVLDSLDPPNRFGRPRADRRRLVEGIVFRMKTGRPWREIPKAYGDDSTAHRTFHRWDEAGIFEQIWTLVSREHPELRNVPWQWHPLQRSTR